MYVYIGLILIHNLIAHPLLPIGELFEHGVPKFLHFLETLSKGVAKFIFLFHDITVPKGSDDA